MGGYIRLSDFVGPDNQAPKALEAISNPTCGWFYRTDASTFHDIPGTPIAYWASEGMKKLFMQQITENRFEVGSGLSTGDNSRFLRLLWEVSRDRIAKSNSEMCRWYLFQKGGEYRKWFGNLEYVVDWENDGERIKYWVTHNPNDPKTTSWSRRIFNAHLYFLSGISWSVISSSRISFRSISSNSMISNAAGGVFDCKSGDISDELLFALAAFNSTTWQEIFSLLNPTINYSSGVIAKAPLPFMEDSATCHYIAQLARDSISLAKVDWDSQETSWDYMRNSLI